MGCIDLALRFAMLAPGRHERPVLRELDDAVVGPGAVPVGDIEVAVGRDHDGTHAAQIARSVARHPGLADRHQHLAVRAELEQVGALAVLGDLIAGPDTAVVVDIERMRDGEQAGANRPLELAGRIEPHERRQRRVGAFARPATVEHPYALAVAVIDLNLDDAAKFPVGGELRPAFLHLIGIRRRIGGHALARTLGHALGVAPISRDHHQGAGRDADHQCQADCMPHRSSSRAELMLPDTSGLGCRTHPVACLGSKRFRSAQDHSQPRGHLEVIAQSWRKSFRCCKPAAATALCATSGARSCRELDQVKTQERWRSSRRMRMPQKSGFSATGVP